MKQLLDYIIPNIVNHPEDVVITQNSTPEGTTLLIDVNSEDMGRVIGKEGKVIKAIRQIARVMAIKQGIRLHIDILDKGVPTTEPSVETPTETPAETPAETPETEAE